MLAPRSSLFVLAFLALLASCGDGENTDTDTTTGDASENASDASTRKDASEFDARQTDGGENFACSSCSQDQVCGKDSCIGPMPYPERDAYRLKAIQPDYWEPKDDISGANTGGIAMNLVWADWEPVVKNAPCDAGEHEYQGRCFVIDTNVDPAIRDWSARGLIVTAVVYGVPPWARTQRICSPVSPGFEIFCAPDDAADYARFAGMIADRYDGLHDNGRIADFVIHNEVNANDWFDIGCGQGVACDQEEWISIYSDNYNAAYDAIAAEQPSGKTLISLEHHFQPEFDTPAAANPLMSGMTMIRGVAARAGARQWQIAYHPYPPDLLSPQFGPEDLPKVTYGNIGVIAGWLRAEFPNNPAAWELQLTESGVNSLSPSSTNAGQVQGLCDSFRNILGTPGITNYVYHRLKDHPVETASGLGLGLRDTAGVAKPAWNLWASVNRIDLTPSQLSCGFEDLPYTRLTRSNHPVRGHWSSSRIPPSGFVAESSFRLLRDSAPGTQMLYECAVGAAGSGHNLLSQDPGCELLQPMGPVGYVHQSQQPDTVALYRCATANGADHFVSPDTACEGQTTESLLGYVYPN